MRQVCAVVVLLIFEVGFTYAQEPDDDFIIEVDSLNVSVQPSTCDIEALISEARDRLGRTNPRHHTNITWYYAFSRLPDGTMKRSQQRDYIWREIPVVLVNAKSCETVDTEIVKRIQNRLAIVSINDDRFMVDLEERTYGKTWNSFNTPFLIGPEGWVVIADKYRCKEACLHNFNSVVYSPYSRSLHDAFPQLVRLGADHLESDFSEAIADLRKKGVRSRAFPDSLVADIAEHRFARLLRTLDVIEHTDPQSFDAYIRGITSYNPFQRMLLIVGANGNSAYSFTTSIAGARGKNQIMPTTCNGRRDSRGRFYPGIRQLYSDAHLPPFCDSSPYDDPHGHIINDEAKILVVDDKLTQLKDGLGAGVLDDPDLDRYLAAAYNGGAGTVIASVRRYGDQWDLPRCRPPRGRCVGLMGETAIYVQKFDYVVEHLKEIFINP